MEAAPSRTAKTPRALLPFMPKHTHTQTPLASLTLFHISDQSEGRFGPPAGLSCPIEASQPPHNHLFLSHSHWKTVRGGCLLHLALKYTGELHVGKVFGYQLSPRMLDTIINQRGYYSPNATALKQRNLAAFGGGGGSIKSGSKKYTKVSTLGC